MYEVQCDKCSSNNVVQRVKDSKPPEKPVVTMGDVVAGNVPKPATYINAVMTYTTYIFECQNCGYVSEPFTEGINGNRPATINLSNVGDD